MDSVPEASGWQIALFGLAFIVIGVVYLLLLRTRVGQSFKSGMNAVHKLTRLPSYMRSDRSWRAGFIGVVVVGTLLLFAGLIEVFATG